VSPTRDELHASGAATGALAWVIKRQFVAPIAIGHDFYGLTPIGERSVPGQVMSVDAETGKPIWSDPLPGDFDSADFPPPTVAVSPGLLLIAGGGHVTAYESVFRPSPDGIDIGADAFDVIAGRAFSVVGVLGTSIRGPRPRVEIQGAPSPGGDFRRLSDEPSARDGGFFAPIVLARNSRFRAVVGGAASPPITVYAYPNVALGRPRWVGRTRLRMDVRVKAPAARFGGRTFVLYLDRVKSKRLQRIGSGRLRQVGRGRARTTLVFTPLRKVGRRDTVVFCVRGQVAMGLGRPSSLTRRCGARRVQDP
jgi:hypothetical protein